MQAEMMQLRERKANYDLLLQEKEEQATALGTVLLEMETLRQEKSRFDQMLKEKEKMAILPLSSVYVYADSENGDKLVMRTNTDFEAPSGAIVEVENGEICSSNDF